VPDDSPLITDLPDEEVFSTELEAPWELYFDGASRMDTEPDGTPRRRAGAGLVFKTPQGGVMYHSFSLLKHLSFLKVSLCKSALKKGGSSLQF
jgi:hypothetical protein